MRVLVGRMVPLARKMMEPALARMGTAAAAFLLGQGVPADMAEQAIVAVGVLGGLVFDICVHLYVRGR